MNIKITCENSSVIVPNQSRESIIIAMHKLEYQSMIDSAGLKFYRKNDAGNEIEARCTVEPTTDPVTE